jgi:hypothetical protein
MRNYIITAALFAVFALTGVGQAFAGGGMGDVAANVRGNNERCEAQRRGEYPKYFNACLPDYPVTQEGPEPGGPMPARGHGGGY